MRHHRLDAMTKGWFVGDFSPAALRSADVEVGVKRYAAGAREDRHHHKIATELTLVVSGEISMMGRAWGPGDIVTVEPGETTAFEAITDCVTVVVKLPSVLGDKYAADDGDVSIDGSSQVRR